MKVSEINNQRFDVALELFSEGKKFNFDDVSFYINEETKTIEVCIASQWEIANLTEQRAFEELKRAEKIHEYLMTHSKVFADIVRDYKLRLSIAKDIGNAWIEICYLTNEKLIWI